MDNENNISKHELDKGIYIINNLINYYKERIVGLEEIDEDLLKTLSFRNDVMTIVIKDINLFEKKSYVKKLTRNKVFLIAIEI